MRYTTMIVLDGLHWIGMCNVFFSAPTNVVDDSSVP